MVRNYRRKRRNWESELQILMNILIGKYEKIKKLDTNIFEVMQELIMV